MPEDVKKLKSISKVCLYTAIGIVVIFFFIQVLGLTNFLNNPESTDPIPWILSLHLIKIIWPLSVFLWGIAFGLLTKAKGYSNIVSFFIFLVSLSIAGAVVYFFLPDKAR